MACTGITLHKSSFFVKSDIKMGQISVQLDPLPHSFFYFEGVRFVKLMPHTVIYGKVVITYHSMPLDVSGWTVLPKKKAFDQINPLHTARKETSSATAEISHRPHEVHPREFLLYYLDLKLCYTDAFRWYIFQLLIFLILGQNTP